MKPLFEDRTLQGIVVLGSMVGYEISPDVLLSWSCAQVQVFEIWAERTHLHASDNPVRVPPRPSWLPYPWKGPQGEWGNTATVLMPLAEVHSPAQHEESANG